MWRPNERKSRRISFFFPKNNSTIVLLFPMMTQDRAHKKSAPIPRSIEPKPLFLFLFHHRTPLSDFAHVFAWDKTTLTRDLSTVPRMTKGPGKTMKDTMTHRVTINSKTYIYRWIVINPIHRWTRPLVKNEILPVVFAITAIHIHVTLEELSLPTVPGKPINPQRHLWRWTSVWDNFRAPQIL